MRQTNGRSEIQMIVNRSPSNWIHCRPPLPRKLPQQSRSKMLFMSIQQACVEVFKCTEMERVTMNLIAEHAGVTMGSVYQYFNGIDSVIGSIYEAIIERAFRRESRLATGTAKLEKQLAEFDTLFARTYYQDFYRHVLAINSPLFCANACGTLESVEQRK